MTQVKNKRYGESQQFAGEKFPSDIFLVFGNRLLAMVVAAGMVMLPLRKEPAGGWTPQVCLKGGASTFFVLLLRLVLLAVVEFGFVRFGLVWIGLACSPIMFHRYIGVYAQGRS